MKLSTGVDLILRKIILYLSLITFICSCDFFKNRSKSSQHDPKKTTATNTDKTNRANEDVLRTNSQKSLYTIGAVFANRVKYLNLSKEEADFVMRGFRDHSLEGTKAIDTRAFRNLVQPFIEKRTKETASIFKKKGEKYLKDFVKKGATLTKTGLAYKITKKGNSNRPSIDDSIEIHYHGTFIDGKVFDSSVDRKEKMTLYLYSVIPAWQEALPLVGEGGEIEIVVPSDLAYGDHGSPPMIPGGATLVFKINLYTVINTKTALKEIEIKPSKKK